VVFYLALPCQFIPKQTFLTPMPVISASAYTKRPRLFRNGHQETVLPSLLRFIRGVKYKRERLELEDGDFLDLDWIKNGHSKVVIISHGLEGSSKRHYVKSAARFFAKQGFDVLAWNYRSCSESMNRNLRLYHHGVTDDLGAVVDHAVAQQYANVYLMGFSMGGSTTLKYLGEQGSNVPKQVTAASVFSVPCNLWDSGVQLKLPENSFYKNRFLKKLKKKVFFKWIQYPNQMNIQGLDEITDFDEFDDRFTAPLHGFKSGKEFYEKSSSDNVYGTITTPALIVNALNDPLLGDKCYPYDQARNHQYLYLETPEIGGHVGFTTGNWRESWMEVRALEFFKMQEKE
jgi:predicted alpha/beta-fold hydrolase